MGKRKLSKAKARQVRHERAARKLLREQQAMMGTPLAPHAREKLSPPVLVRECSVSQTLFADVGQIDAVAGTPAPAPREKRVSWADAENQLPHYASQDTVAAGASQDDTIAYCSPVHEPPPLMLQRSNSVPLSPLISRSLSDMSMDDIFGAE
mmetsp:Transcript_21073/g.62910  ORF Transcript_21073/g.62910 Transcript_21073/m.62910 type:complete len:152 (-) Transcript_21073:113-568(-)|eukprot:CAMPEP_0119268904 /NCGR_PEP_ID=MMETSP1329-20130426/6516_1 /TAXON_ID=114041 /ORGANISM="Genus nov. species nov., Strain RCC1024" /LENGTH=151 /DNA_ID=CAMNT_0007268889 /DNA_START=231 /DNA_END=686 /DNA_ORIENTATION=-